MPEAGQPHVAEPFDFTASFLALRPTGAIERLPHEGRPPRLDGFTIGVWETSAPAGHGGELHPDGDEAASGIAVAEGQGCVVPKGVWRKAMPQGPCRSMRMTPGPSIQFRPAAPRGQPREDLS